jgi:hypothetical protein
LIKVFLFGLWCLSMSKTNHQHINEQSIRHFKCILMILWKPLWMTSLASIIWLITYKSFNIILEPTKIMILVWTLKNGLSWFLLVWYLVSLFQRKERNIYIYSKEIQALVNIHVPNSPHHMQVFNGMVQFYHFMESYFYFEFVHEVDET